MVAADEPEALRRAWSAYPLVRRDDPFPGGPGPAPRASFGTALTFSDVLTPRELRRLELYDVLFRPFAIADTMKLFLPMRDGRGASFVFDRERRGFTKRDRAVLNALAPHLRQLHARHRDGTNATLTRREREIVDWVARGKTNSEIASILWLAPGTVRKHLDNVYAKLGVSNRAEAVASLLR